MDQWGPDTHCSVLSGPALSSVLSWWNLGKGILGDGRLPGESFLTQSFEMKAPGKGSVGRVGVKSGWGWAGAPSSLGLPHLGQGFDAHQVHKADPTHVEDEGVEGDKGWDAGQHVIGLSRGWGLAAGSGGVVRAEGDVGHAGRR